MSASATETDCQAARDMVRAERTVLRAGQVLDRAEVGVPDVLASAWRQENTQIRYRMRLDRCPLMADGGLWIYRLGGPYRAWIDGQPVRAIAPTAPDGEQVYNGRVPALFELPSSAGELVIEIVELTYVGSGLIRVVTGPHASLLGPRALGQRTLTGLNNLTSTLIGMAGVLALLVWFYRRQDRATLWFAAACLAWATRGVIYQWFTYPPTAALAIEQLNPWLVLLTGSSLAVSWLYAFGGATPARIRAAVVLCVAISLAFALTLLLGRGAYGVRALSFVCGFAVLFAVLAFLLQRWREGGRSAGLLAMGLVALIAGCLHDIGMVAGFVSPANWSFLNVGFALLLLSHVVVILTFQVKQLNRAEQTNEELEHKIRAKSQALEESYTLLRSSERASARAQERARFNREIHDGVGAQLITALRGVERGAMSKEQVAQTLQEGLDELRLLMDAADLGKSLYRALAAWRNRWDSRLQAIGLELHWQVGDDLEHLELGSNATLQVMRVLQEAVTNTIKHAMAQSVTVRAWIDEAGQRSLVLEMGDNGRGLHAAPSGTGGRGLRHMAQRAQTLGGTLAVENAPDGGVLVRLRLPLSDPAFEASDTAPLMP